MATCCSVTSVIKNLVCTTELHLFNHPPCKTLSDIPFQKFIHSISHYMSRPIWSSSGIKVVICWRLLYFRYCSSIIFLCGPIYVLVYPILIGHSSCCAVCVYKWSQLCDSVSHSDVSFFMLCCMCLYVVLSMC
jgi:hypothetical protein